MGKAIFYIIIILVVFICSCNKKKSTNNKQAIIMSAQVNGKYWTAKQASVVLNTANTYHITIHVDSGKSNINLYINNYIGNGIYPLENINNVADSPNRAYFTETPKDTAVVHSAVGGIITIQNSYTFGNKLTGITGYFSFEADTIKVTNGYFNVLLNLE